MRLASWATEWGRSELLGTEHNLVTDTGTTWGLLAVEEGGITRLWEGRLRWGSSVAHSDGEQVGHRLEKPPWGLLDVKRRLMASRSEIHPSDSVPPSRLHQSHPCVQSPPPSPGTPFQIQVQKAFTAFMSSQSLPTCMHPSISPWRLGLENSNTNNWNFFFFLVFLCYSEPQAMNRVPRSGVYGPLLRIKMLNV